MLVGQVIHLQLVHLKEMQVVLQLLQGKTLLQAAVVQLRQDQELHQVHRKQVVLEEQAQHQVLMQHQLQELVVEAVVDQQITVLHQDQALEAQVDLVVVDQVQMMIQVMQVQELLIQAAAVAEDQALTQEALALQVERVSL